MTREISYVSMVQLPRMNVSSAVAFGEALGTVAGAEISKGTTLPPLIERPRVRLETATRDLAEELQPEAGVDSKAAVNADKGEDGGWRSLSEWMGALCGMPDGSFEGQQQLRSLHTTLFSEGLRFLALPFREEWSQSEARLKTIDTGENVALIERLGGSPLLSNLRDAHAHYGKVLGITAPVDVKESPVLRAKFLKLTDAIRAYIVKVKAWADPEDPGSEALSDTLLAPFVAWKDTPIRTGQPTPTPVEPDTITDSE
jgi:hypothetical protein